jgi:hypothetical protein
MASLAPAFPQVIIMQIYMLKITQLRTNPLGARPAGLSFGHRAGGWVVRWPVVNPAESGGVLRRGHSLGEKVKVTV